MTYRQNYLKQVIFEVRYPRVDRLLQLLDETVNSSIKQHFPVYSETTDVYVSTASSSNRSQTSHEIIKKWIFTTHQGSVKLFINCDAIRIEYTQYNNRSEFMKSINDVVLPSLRTLLISRASRIGIRYINIFDLPSKNIEELSRYFAPGIVNNSSLSINIDNFVITRAMQQIYRQKDDITLLLQFGIFNEQFPLPISYNQYILDIDAYSFDTEISGLDSKANLLLENIHALFEACITQNLKDLLDNGMERNHG